MNSIYFDKNGNQIDECPHGIINGCNECKHASKVLTTQGNKIYCRYGEEEGPFIKVK